MTEQYSLSKLSQATQLLAECKTVDEAKPVRDMAEAARHYARVSGLGADAINYATEIKLRAERRMGQLLKEMDVKSGRPPSSKNGAQGGTILTDYSFDMPNAFPEEAAAPPTLAEMEISKKQSSRWQQIADLPDERFESHIARAKEGGKELTTAGLLREAQAHKRQQMASAKQDAPPLPGEKYRVIYADPPWSYGNSGVINDSDAYGRAARHYPTMSIDQLCELGHEIKKSVAENAVLFLWVTSPLLEDSFKVINAWGFNYKTSFIWDKIRHNFGHYNSVRHELLLICTRGSCTPDDKTLHDSVVAIERTDVHSQKPEEFRQMIDSLYTWGRRLELFARSQAAGWDTWGNEA